VKALPSRARLRTVASTRFRERGALPVLAMDWIWLPAEGRGVEWKGQWIGSCFRDEGGQWRSGGNK
jgi:hypothetical protein